MSFTIFDESQFPYTYDEMIELSGIKSLYYVDDPDYKDEPGDQITIEVIDFKLYEYISVEIRCAYIDSLIIQFLYEGYVIYILRFISTGLRRGVTARCVKEQEDIAKIKGYRTIFLLAYKHKDPYISQHTGIKYKYVGYIVWGKIGFLFYDPNDRINFLRTARNFDPSRKMLHLLLKDEEGTQYWSANGFKWFGEFQIGPGTQSSGILRNYLRKILN